MSVETNIKDSILKAIDTIAQRRIDQLKVDKTITAIINAPVGVVNGKKIYKVEYEGGYFNATAQNKGDAYLPRMAVYVQIPEGNFSKEKFILGQASKLTTDAQISVVAATVNNFSIIGNNSITKKTDNVMGVHSYHDVREETVDTKNKKIKNIEHRYNFLYKYGENTTNQLNVLDENLNLYKKDANAIMIRADFMTKLTEQQKQQITGEYGLVFNLVFKNLAAGLGETQGEIFHYFEEEISNKGKTLSLKTINEKLQNYLNTKIVTDLTKVDGCLEEILNQIQELERIFKEESRQKYTETVQDLISKYTVLIEDIKTRGTKTQMWDTYNNWNSTKVGQSAEKTVSYYLSSNDMIGNPFSFSSWTDQYAVFKIDLDNFLRVDSILLYKEGFIQNSALESNWQEGQPDILIQDIQMYMMKPLSENNSGYQLKVEAPETGFVFETLNDNNQILAKAALLREFYEDLTVNQDTTFYWFKQNSSIVSPRQEQYSVYAGIGWSRINVSTITDTLKISAEDNQAYENYYRCAVVYMGEETPIILRYDFIVYNRAGKRFVLQSDLGTDFSFDAGTPTITIFREDENEKLIELAQSESDVNKHYRLKWALIDGNNQKVFLDEEVELNLSDITISNYTSYSGTSKLLNGIEWYNGNTKVITANDKKYASRIKYPLSNVPTASSVTFECYIDYRADTSQNFATLGKAILELNNFKVLSANSYRVYIEGGDQVFQYDEYGNAPNSPKYKDPRDILPLKAHLFAPNNIEIQESSYRVRWYFPLRETLIQYNGASKDPVTNKENLYIGNEVGFDISPLYNYNAFDNQIRCQIDFNDQTIYASTEFIFTKVGNDGTNGTDMVAKISPKTWYSIYNDQPVILYVSENNNRIYVNGIPNYITAGNRWLTGPNGIFDVKLYQKTQEVEVSQSDTIRWNVAGNTSTSSNKNGKNIAIENNLLRWYNSTNKAYRQYILKAEWKHNDKVYYASYGLPVIFYKSTLPTYDSSRIAIATSGYVKEVVYNADGRNPLYNHNQGLELINLPKNATVNWYAKGGYNTSENTPCFKLLLDKDGKAQNAFTSKTNTDKSKVYILPDDAYSGAITNNYIQAEVKLGSTLIATIYAPINMSLNTYGLASLNAWDGNTINIDNDNGYIMAPQIGAGYKDDTTNHFTGVVMGQADDYSSNGKHEYTGLIGYSHGVQSIFLNAENGSASFGVPSWTDSTGKELVRKWNGSTWINSEDNYNEGRIELNPSGVSKIGGWRLGRRSLYYVEGNIEIGPKYGTSTNGYDYIPKKNGVIDRGTEYSNYHEKDIPHNKAGILIHSGQNPYVSIKGKQISSNDSTLDTTGDSFIRVGDSIELQLDPMSPTVFSIFRHNGTPVKKPDGSNLYETNSRTFLAGMSPQGELVANTLQSIINPTQGKETTANFSTNRIAAFGQSKINATYIGTMSRIGTITIAKIFKEADSDPNDTLYFSGSGSNTNEYIRPLSFHGKDISLYVSEASSINTTTDAYVKISSSNFNAAIGSTSFNLSRTGNNSLSTIGAMTAYIGATNSRRNFALYSANQTYNANNGWNVNITGGDASLVTSNGSVQLTANGSGKSFNIKSTNNAINITSGTTMDMSSGGKITMTTSNASDIEFNRYINDPSSSNTKVLIGGSNFLARVNGNNYLDIRSADKNSALHTSNDLTVQSENGQLVLKGNVGNNGGSGIDSVNDVVIKAGDSTSIRFKDYFWGGGSYPMEMNFGPAGYLQAYFPNDKFSNPPQTTSAYSQFQVGMNLYTPFGMEIAGNYMGNDFGLFVHHNIHGGLGIYADNYILSGSSGGQNSWPVGTEFQQMTGNIQANGWIDGWNVSARNDMYTQFLEVNGMDGEGNSIVTTNGGINVRGKNNEGNSIVTAHDIWCKGAIDAVDLGAQYLEINGNSYGNSIVTSNDILCKGAIDAVDLGAQYLEINGSSNGNSIVTSNDIHCNGDIDTNGNIGVNGGINVNGAIDCNNVIYATDIIINGNSLIDILDKKVSKDTYEKHTHHVDMSKQEYLYRTDGWPSVEHDGEHHLQNIALGGGVDTDSPQ